MFWGRRKTPGVTTCRNWPAVNSGRPRRRDHSLTSETIVGDEEAAALVARRYREGHWAVPKMS